MVEAEDEGVDGVVLVERDNKSYFFNLRVWIWLKLQYTPNGLVALSLGIFGPNKTHCSTCFEGHQRQVQLATYSLFSRQTERVIHGWVIVSTADPYFQRALLVFQTIYATEQGPFFHVIWGLVMVILR